jgi:hypothetical protein
MSQLKHENNKTTLTYNKTFHLMKQIYSKMGFLIFLSFLLFAKLCDSTPVLGVNNNPILTIPENLCILQAALGYTGKVRLG